VELWLQQWQCGGVAVVVQVWQWFCVDCDPGVDRQVVVSVPLEPPFQRGSDETRIIGWCQVLMEIWQRDWQCWCGCGSGCEFLVWSIGSGLEWQCLVALEPPLKRGSDETRIIGF
jgi:hypothetical protein